MALGLRANTVLAVDSSNSQNQCQVIQQPLLDSATLATTCVDTSSDKYGHIKNHKYIF